MFKELYKKHLVNHAKIKIFISLTILVIALDLIFYFVLSDKSSKTALYWMLAIHVFLLLGNWITNVIVPRGRLRKSVPEEYKKYKKKSMTPKEIAELDYYANGLSFSTLLIIPLGITILFTII